MGFSTIFKPSDTSTTRFETPILLDGGMGTTLEDVFHKDIAHPLWSTKLVDNEEDIIVAAHLAFLQAGSQVILTSTYQAAHETFARAHYSKPEAERLMLKSVELAIKARETYERTISGMTDKCTRTKIALSLGPYGATLEPAAEFTGIYPPPFGPSQLSPASVLDPEQRPLTEPDSISYTDALASFHFSRLMVYARHANLWNSIDLLAFETIPLVTEGQAIRIAVARLEDWFQETAPREQDQGTTSTRMKPWYISFVFPGPRGEFIQSHPVTKGSETQVSESFEKSAKIPAAYTAYEVAQSALSSGTGGSQRKMSVPDGIGVNCTPCHVLAPIIEGFATALRDLSPETIYQTEELPWLVICPNGGLAYDPVRRTWVDIPSIPAKQIEGREENWANALAELIGKGSSNLPAADITVFGGLLIGGCCKTGPNQIKDLKSHMSKS